MSNIIIIIILRVQIFRKLIVLSYRIIVFIGRYTYGVTTNISIPISYTLIIIKTFINTLNNRILQFNVYYI